MVIINCYVYSIVGKKDELEIGIVIGFCLGNFREYNEVLLCWLFLKKKKEKSCKG